MRQIDFYSDYREFLHDWYDEQKRLHSCFSYRYFCRRADISSPALYKEVVEGRRNLTERTVELFINGIGLSEKDAVYFRTLVKFNQTENEAEKIRLLEQLRGLRKMVRQEVVPLDLYEYYTTWYYPAIRELACIVDWKDDYRVLAQTIIPALKKSEAENAIRFLIDKGFIRKRDDGRYEQTNPAITTGSEVSSIAVRSFNTLMAEKGAASIREFPPSERDVRTVITGISETAYRQIKEEIRDFVARVVRLVHDDGESNRVYGLNLQLFPLSKQFNEGDISDETT